MSHKKILTLEQHVERMLARESDRSEASAHRNAGASQPVDHQAERERQEREQ